MTGRRLSSKTTPKGRDVLLELGGTEGFSDVFRVDTPTRLVAFGLDEGAAIEIYRVYLGASDTAFDGCGDYQGGAVRLEQPYYDSVGFVRMLKRCPEYSIIHRGDFLIRYVGANRPDVCVIKINSPEYAERVSYCFQMEG